MLTSLFLQKLTITGSFNIEYFEREQDHGHVRASQWVEKHRIVPYKHLGVNYIWTFNDAPVPFPPNGHIVKVSKNAQAVFQVLSQHDAGANFTLTVNRHPQQRR